MSLASAANAIASPPISWTAASNRFWSRPVIATRAPSSTKRFAVASPMPLDPPVMKARLPDNFMERLPRYRVHHETAIYQRQLTLGEVSVEPRSEPRVELLRAVDIRDG